MGEKIKSKQINKHQVFKYQVEFESKTFRQNH